MIEECSVSGGGSVSGLELPQHSVLQSTAVRPRLAVNEITTYRWSLIEDVIGLQEAGIDAVGLWRPKLTEFGEERATELIRDSGLAVSSVSWAGGFTGACGQSFNESIEDALEAIRLSYRVGADCLILVSGSRAGHTTNHARRLFTDAVKRLADEAARYDLRLGIEPMHRSFAHNWTFLTTLDQTLDVLNACRRPNVGMVFDTRHLRDEPHLLQRIPEIAEHVVGVQLNDWLDNVFSENDGGLPGDGVLPLSEMMDAFLSCGYRGFFEVEAWSEDLWRSDYAELLASCRSRFELLCES